MPSTLPSGHTVSLLLRLPPEIRLMIYEYSFYGSQWGFVPDPPDDYTPKTVFTRRSGFKDREPKPAFRVSAHWRLLMTCRGVFEEASPTYWGATALNAFTFTWGEACDLYHKIPDDAAKYVRHLQSVSLGPGAYLELPGEFVRLLGLFERLQTCTFLPARYSFINDDPSGLSQIRRDEAIIAGLLLKPTLLEETGVKKITTVDFLGKVIINEKFFRASTSSQGKTIRMVIFLNYSTRLHSGACTAELPDEVGFRMVGGGGVFGICHVDVDCLNIAILNCLFSVSPSSPPTRFSRSPSPSEAPQLRSSPLLGTRPASTSDLHEAASPPCMNQGPHIKSHKEALLNTLNTPLKMRDMPLDHGSLEHLLPSHWKTQITAWLAEDTPSFDYGGFVVGEVPRTATLWGKSGGILAGVPFFNEVFAQTGCKVEWHANEGQHIERDKDKGGIKMKVATVTGPARGILLGERVALNILARCSGVASMSRGFLVNLRSAGYRGQLAGTRKTTPGFRLVEKYGMLVGGADGHRMDLSSMIMLKDNHVWSRGSIRQAVAAAKSVGGFSLKVEVEVQTEAEADEAIDAGADVVMLDNFSGEGVKVAAKSLKQRWAGKRHFLVEVSGGLTLDNAEEYVTNDVDVLSTSAIHQGVPHVDFSLKINH